MTETGIKLHANVTTVVQTYREQTQIIREAMARIADAEAKLTAVFGREHREIRATPRSRSDWITYDNPENVMEHIRRQVWGSLLDLLEVRRMMSVQRAKELDRQLEHGELPEITHESIAEMVRGIQSQLPIMLEEAVEEVFNFLRPIHDEFKTNSQFEIGKRVILAYRVEQKWGGNGYHVHYRREHEFTALENVFTALDGRGQIQKGHQSELQRAIAESQTGTGETTYFRFKCFKKGTLHLEFRRPDLVKRLNQIAGRRRLRGNKAA